MTRMLEGGRSFIYREPTEETLATAGWWLLVGVGGRRRRDLKLGVRVGW